MHSILFTLTLRFRVAVVFLGLMLALMSDPKKDPTEKSQSALAADGRCYFSYAQTAATVHSAVPEVCCTPHFPG